MSLKDLFGKTSEKIVSNKQLQDLYEQAESEGFLEELVEDRQRYLPSVDFSNFSNYIIYGSAERYFVDGITNIYQNYPYDGSKKEKQDWRNNSSQLDLYIFDEIYPKTKGYVVLSGSNVSVNGSNIRSSSAPQYVLIKGGPNQSADGKFEKSNIYDLDTNRESNLGITQNGNTVEFWFKDNVTSGSSLSTAEYCLLDLWNGNSSGSANYTRLTISKQYSTSNNKFFVTYVSGTAGIVSQLLDYDFDPYSWHHYAFTFSNTNITDLEVCLFVDGNLVKKTNFASVGSINLADNSNLIAFLGAYRADQNGNSSSYSSLGQSHGSYDEFRFWKTARTPRQIYRNWFTNVGGGSNTDDSNTNLGVYFKFNEGIVDNSSINSLDAVCLDYSGRVSNGTIINYDVNCKSTSSAIDIYFDTSLEQAEPIVFSSNPLVQNKIEEYTDLGFQYDVTNVSSIYRKLPSWITEEAEKDNYPDLQRLVQIISSYFDTLHLQIKNLSSIKNIEYSSENDKPKPFYSNILASHGFDNIEIFNNSTFLEDVLSRNESSEFENKISDIKNVIYQNIYNNLSYIYKSKGTEKSFRNLIRSFGVDNELIKINLYANNAEYDFSDKYNYTSINKKYIDFNNPNRYSGTVIQYYKSADTDTNGYITGLASGKLDYAPITVQAEILFPKKSDSEFENYQYTDFTDISLFGSHTANSNNTVLSWANNDNFNFQVYAIKNDPNSTDVYFKLTGSLSASGFSLTSSWYPDVYENKKWNLAVRIKPDKLGNIGYSSGSSNTDYVIEFVGYNSILDTKLEEGFILSATIPQADAISALRENKRLYAGAHYDNYDSSSLLAKTDVKVSSVRYWLDYLTDEELKNHSYDASSYGSLRPNWRPDFITDNLIVTKADMLLLNWSFDSVTGTNNQGQFIVDDISSGSVDLANRYGLDWLGPVIGYQQSGLAFGFGANDSQVANKEYIYSAKIATPEIFNGSDMIQVPATDDFARTKIGKPVSFYFSIEKSMAQIINDEILNWFATIKNFNNLIGLPNHKYKKEYSDLVHMRKIFFEKVNNEPDYEKFLEFYKWIDSSISMMIGQLAPASANVSDKVRNVVENTLLDRNKYENKLPIIKYKDRIVPVGGGGGLSQINYSSLRAPSSPAGKEWYKKRAIRTQEISGSGETITTPLEPQNDIDREIIRQVINYSSYGKDVTLYSAENDTFYEGKKDLNKIYSKHYVLNADKLLIVEGKILGNELTNISSSNQFIFAADLMASSSDTQVIDPSKSLYNIISTPTLFDLDSSSSYAGIRKATKTSYKFKNPYEYFQTSGRSANNKAFVDLEGGVSGTANIDILEVTSRTLPNRNTANGNGRKTIFVERFSAPGGPEVNSRGALDSVAEEYSAYNSLNYRNFRVRKHLNSWLAETSSFDEQNPSYHKVPNNIARYPADDNGNSINSQNDNAFISHAIPRSDRQYAWVNASLDADDGFSGYASEFANLNKSYQTISSSEIIGLSSIPYVNFRYLDSVSYNNLLTDKIINTGSNIISTGSLFATTLDYFGLYFYLTTLNGPYQYPSWKQIRNSENPIVVQSKKNNNILVQDQSIQLFKSVNGTLVPYVDSKSQTFKAYKEPPIEYNIPMKHVVEVSGSTGSIEVISTYDNNINKFANASLMTTLGQKERSELQTHNTLVAMSKGEYIPEPQILSASYSKMLFPSRKYVGLKETRTRPNYTEIAGTGSNGYDRNSAKIRTFWKDAIADRQRTNAFFSSNKTGSINCLNIAQLSASTGISNAIFAGYVRHSSSTWDNIQPAFAVETNFSNYYDSFNSIEYSSSYTMGLIAYGLGIIVYTTESYTLTSDLAGFSELEAQRFLSAQPGTYFYIPVTGTNGKTIQVEHFRYDPAVNFVRPKPSYAYKIHYPSVASQRSSSYGLANIYTTAIRHFINEGMYYNTNILAGKNPWYNTYEQYFEDFEDLKPYSISASILPEFNYSENGDYYISGNTTIPPNNYISFAGTDAEVNNIDNAYNLTDKLDNFILNDLEGNKKIKLSINGVKKLLPYKGFYPQERAVQIVDLFQKSFFNISMNDITGGYPTYKYYRNDTVAHGGGSPIIQQMQTLLQPYFAPGILFNTIKSGIAVDWPILYSDTPQEKYYNSSILGSVHKYYPPNHNTASFATSSINEKVMFLSGAFSARIPFESLLNLKGLDTNQVISYIDPTRFNTETFTDITSSTFTNGFPASTSGLRKNPIFSFNDPNNNEIKTFKDDRYTKAINNYLAEIPKFFLQNSSLTEFTSKNFSGDLRFESGKTYEMKLQISMPEKYRMILDTTDEKPYYYDFGDIVTNTRIAGASVFGPPTQYFVDSSGSELKLGHKAYDGAAYAPYAPPYLYGPQVIKFQFTPEDGITNYTYDQIISALTVSCEPSTDAVYNYFSQSAYDINNGNNPKNFTNTMAYANKMPLSSSIRYDLIVKEPLSVKEANGNIKQYDENTDNTKTKWKIQTKFETPVFNFNNDLNKSIDTSYTEVLPPVNYTKPHPILTSLNDKYDIDCEVTKYGFTGMWGGYATGDALESGLTLQLLDGVENKTTGNLAEVCGFEIATKKVGQIADKKQISEAIVMIPYTSTKDNDFASVIKPPAGEENNEKYYFRVQKIIISQLFDDNNININFNLPPEDKEAIKYKNIKKLLNNSNLSNNSILNTMKLMTQYILPPHLDWVYDRNIEPFVMYIFEFKHELTKQELADIWQGVMPESAMKTSLDSPDPIEHALTEKEFFHGKKLPNDIKWKVFKIKKRAEHSYDQLVNYDANKDENPFSYNWPYDYFSLVELVNIKASLEVENESKKEAGTA